MFARIFKRTDTSPLLTEARVRGEVPGDKLLTALAAYCRELQFCEGSLIC